MDSLEQQWQSDSEESKTISYVVHEFNMGDVEDPDLWAAQSLYEWEKTPAGNWVMNNSNPIASWHRHPHLHYGWRYEIHAYLTSKQLVYYKLKFE
jgi:hypothetical protein